MGDAGAACRTAIVEAFRAAGARGVVHAVDVDDAGRDVGIDPDEPVVTASVFKIPVMVTLARDAAAGRLALTDRVRVGAGDRTVGPTGLSVMCDDVELSVRDLAFLMMSVSDNTATDVVMRLLGPDRVNETMRALGLDATVVDDDCRRLLDGLMLDLGITEDDIVDLAAIDAERFRAARALTPARTNRTTPRELTRLLAMVWRDEAGPADACAEVRRIMALQVWPHRLSSAFGDGTTVSAKTGTLPGIRNEAGVVQLADGRRYAVAVFTVADDFRSHRPEIDASIGVAARLAVDYLGGGASTR